VGESFRLAFAGASDASSLGIEGDYARIIAGVISGLDWSVRGAPVEVIDARRAATAPTERDEPADE